MGLIGSIAKVGSTFGLSEENVIRWIVSSGKFRKTLNQAYNKWDSSRKEAFHERFARIFRNQQQKGVSGYWTIFFAKKEIKVPLRSDQFWLDWDSAISYLGHDLDVKTTYSELLHSSNPPKLFFDVGANYGTHTVLMSSVGVESIPFEPNPNCLPYFQAALALNNVNVDIQKIGLGASEQEAELWFPEDETWLGTLDLEVKDGLDGQFDLSKEVVQISTMDAFIERTGKHPDLVKIDTEGHEEAVLAGAKKTLNSDKPLVLFESNDGEQRKRLMAIFAESSYSVVALPLFRGMKINPLSETEFVSNTKNNFAAVPANFAIN